MQLEGIMCDQYHYLTYCYENYSDFNMNYVDNQEEF